MTSVTAEQVPVAHPPSGLADLTLPAALEAGSPPEVRGDGRDDVRMMVTRRGTDRPIHAHVRDLPRWLRAGDLLVVNISQPLPVAVPVAGDPGRLVHLATPRPDGDWIVEPRRRVGHGTGELPVEEPGRVPLAGGAHLELLERHGTIAGPARLWRARLTHPGRRSSWLARVGGPVRYAYVDRPWPLSSYRTVYGRVPGSAECPSAGRPLTERLLDRLRAAGVRIAAVVLHCGVSTAPVPLTERYRVPPATAALVNRTRRDGGRVVAVGTSAVRAVETLASADGALRPGGGWTDVRIGPDRPVRAVDGLLTGWHDPDSSHLRLLGSFTDGDEQLAATYRAALTYGYRWHEFGDLHLLLP